MTVLERLRRWDPVLLVACVIFLGITWWTAGVVPAGHEEISTFPSRSTRVLVRQRDGKLGYERSCGDAHPPAVARSEARPMLSLCAGGLSLPLLVMSYASGVPYWHAMLGWPLHHGNVFNMRRWDLLAGLLSLILAYLLVRRLRDRLSAGVTVLVLSVCAPFVILSSMLLQYEAAPWIFTMAAALVALGRPGTGAPSTQRLVVASVLAGFAVDANVKAVFYLAAIALVAWRSKAFQYVSRRVAVRCAGAAALAVAPLLVMNQIQAGGGLGSQVMRRTADLGHSRSLAQIAGEVVNMLRFASDTGSYGFPAWHPLGVLGVVAAAVSAAGAIYVAYVAVRSLIWPCTDPLGAFCGVLVLSFIVISLKLYDQTPAANYGPLHAVFGIMVALAVTALAKRLSTFSPFHNVRRTALLLTVACMLPLAANTFRRMSAARDLPLSVNTNAERALAGYLMAHPAPGTTLYTTTYNLAGVFDSLGQGALTSVRLDRAFACRSGEPSTRSCLAKAWEQFFVLPRALPARIVLPAVRTLTDEPNAMLLEPALTDAAEQAGVRVKVERRFSSRNGAVATTLVRVERSR